MHRTKVSVSFGLLFFSIFLVVPIAFTPPLHAQAPAVGTTVAVKMIDAVDSSKDPAGKQYRASVTKAVDAGNGVMIPQGASESKSLDDLVSAGYLHALPVDPITGAKDWVTVSSDVLLDPDEASGGGISDVHSSSDEVSQLKALRAVRGK